ncbi:hypothetical protein KAF26_05490 [Xanthomonas translucens pv. secalis]|uniref:Uncharacterized protein n=1 Tax=Xanthomonas translucens pv. translucens TaxID=134875 RepID=A0ABW9KTM2_XANCT|nr:hypothetical protein [Xanthomonas translucens]QSQ29963.1 hypothetical protein ISN30_17285 [Xanthomonas translucens pv. translucens]QSQ34241.1 hypothetical protein ISN31_00815 [Xanthomonas translucens pv. translucens]QSQ44870.1 hypothetical protein ISN34_16950 [Xanthomonas translucens pv. translucens]UKE44407.1 hypothetical protein KAF26_05490 [Xanthomonas translucens pv. secalis]
MEISFSFSHLQRRASAVPAAVLLCAMFVTSGASAAEVGRLRVMGTVLGPADNTKTVSSQEVFNAFWGNAYGLCRRSYRDTKSVGLVSYTVSSRDNVGHYKVSSIWGCKNNP